MTRSQMQTSFFGYVALFDHGLRTDRWIEEPVTTAVSILEDGWVVRAVWRGDMVHVVMEVSPDEIDRRDDQPEMPLVDQPPIKLSVFLNVNGTWVNVPDVSLGYCLFEPPKIGHFIVNFVQPIVCAIDGNLESLAAAQNDLNALRKSAHI